VDAMWTVAVGRAPMYKSVFLYYILFKKIPSHSLYFKSYFETPRSMSLAIKSAVCLPACGLLPVVFSHIMSCVSVVLYEPFLTAIDLFQHKHGAIVRIVLVCTGSILHVILPSLCFHRDAAAINSIIICP
jgi:uncharacterized membrane protein